MGASRSYPGTSGNGIDYGNFTSMNGQTEATFLCWQYFEDLTRFDGDALTKSASYANYFDIEGAIVKDNLLITRLDGTRIARSDDATTTLYSTGTWYFKAWTWTGPSTFSFYIDLQSISINTAGTGTSDTIATSANPLYSGRDTNAAIRFEGRMAYNQMYSTTMNLAQIQEQMYNPFVIFENVQFNAPGWNPSATNEIDIIQGISGTPTSASESFDGPPVGCFAAANQ